MGIRISELVDALASTYHSVDIRAAIYKENDCATVLVVAIRLSYEDPAEARARQLALWERQDQPNPPHFTILLDVRPFAEWPRLVHELQCGVLHICQSYYLMDSIDIRTPELNIQVNTTEIRPCDDRPWPAALLSSWPNSQSLLNDPLLIREVSRIGYSDPFEAVNSLCELNVHMGRVPGYLFNLSVPVFARVSSTRVPGDYSSIHVEVEHERNFPKLDARLLVRRDDFLVKEAMVLKRPLEFSRVEQQSSLTTSTGTASIGELRRDDYVEVRLVSPDVGVLLTQSGFAWGYVELTDRNPLWPAMKKFCPPETMSALLTKSHSVRPHKLTASAAFELHVSWLLSCYGFRSIVLGEYENLFSETKVNRGSIDILAAHGRNLFLVACSVGVPKDEDFSRLVNLAGILQQEVFAGSTIHVWPVVFTGETWLGTCKQIGEEQMLAVPVIDSNTVQQLLRLLEKPGAEKFFLQFLASPMLSPLPSEDY